MNRLLALLIVVLFATWGLADDFRGASWGMSMQQVIELEGSAHDFESENALGFADKVAGLNVSVIYGFVKAKRTEIIHGLSGENFEADHGVSYYSLEYFPLVEAEDAQEDADDF